MQERIISEEQALLERVKKVLAETPRVAAPREDDLVEALTRMRDEIQAAKVEDQPALMQQYDRTVSLLEQLRSARGRPVVDPQSPYFGHLRLRENGRPRDLCIGKATAIDGGIRIVDWRNAPISRVFYRYQQGDEFEETVGGRSLEGVVEARRTVVIHRGVLERVSAPEGTFRRGNDGTWETVIGDTPRLAGGEGAAVRAHGVGRGADRRLGTDLEGFRRRADKHLPDIAGLIDAEQFDLITRPTSGLVVVRGTAGSGKTTVALHRIAWLAFEDRAFDSPRTMFLVFSPALRDYVSHVLPSLGVSRVVVRAFGDWLSETRRRHFPRLPKLVRDDTPADVVRVKNHPALLFALERQLDLVRGAPSAEQAVDDWASVLTHLDLLEAAFHEVDPDAFTHETLYRVAEWCRDRHEELLAWLAGDREIEVSLDAEDDALLLRAWQLRVGPLVDRNGRPLSYRHVALDEVQDFTPTDIAVLLHTLDEHRSLTLAGDTQQHITKEGGFVSWTDLFRHLGLEATEVDTLRISYRCTRSIASFAQAVLGPLAEDTPPIATREGPEVELFQFTDHGAAVAFLAEVLVELLEAEPLASIVLLTGGRGMSTLYYEGLARCDVPRLRQVTAMDFTFAPGIEVTEVDQVKGLEFDYVVLVEASMSWYPDSAASRRLLHVGATRAVHQLWITAVDDPSPMVTAALAR